MPAVPEELLWSTSRVCRKRSVAAEEAGGVAVEAVNDLGPFITQQLHSYCFSSTPFSIHKSNKVTESTFGSHKSTT